MRSHLLWPLFVLLSLTLVAGDAEARRRGRRAPLTIAVAPFVGDGSGGRAMAEAIEIELELVPQVIVKGDRWLRSDLRRAKDRGFERKPLARIMKRRKVDILLRGRAVGDELEVIAFAKDGRPRWVKRYSQPDDIDSAAQDIVAALAVKLKRWRKLRPVPLKAAEAEPEPEPRPGRRPVAEPEPEADDVDDVDDVLVEFDAEPGEDAEPEPRRRVAADEEEDDDLDDLLVGGSDDDAKADGGRRRVVAGGSDDDDEGEKPRRRARSFDEDDDEEDRPRRRTLLSDDDGDDEDEEEDRSRRRYVTMDDDEDEDDFRPRRSMAEVDEGGPLAVGPTHWLAFSGGAGGSLWYYEFAGANPNNDWVLGPFTQFGGGGSVSVWPIKYVGAQGWFSASMLPGLDIGGFGANPQTLDVIGASAAVTGRARYPFELGMVTVAPGARLGYRYWGAFVDQQTDATDPNNVLLKTLVPGWQFHALSVGAEVYVAIRALDRRFEVELQLDALPLTRYDEEPDDPGASSRAFLFGSGQLIVRAPIIHPVFIELYGRGVGGLAEFEGLGTRLARDGDPRGPIDGGTVLNSEFGGGAAVGIFF
jgi:hypothetical protein